MLTASTLGHMKPSRDCFGSMRALKKVMPKAPLLPIK
jgi:hypothetical protein